MGRWKHNSGITMGIGRYEPYFDIYYNRSKYQQNNRIILLKFRLVSFSVCDKSLQPKRLQKYETNQKNQ